jgi:hypothetical protein
MRAHCKGSNPPQYKAKCVLCPNFQDTALPYIPLLYYILNKHHTRKYGRPLIRGLKISGYTARGQVSPKYWAKFLSWPLSKIQPFHIYPYVLYRAWKYRKPLIRGQTISGHTARGQIPHCIKQSVFCAQLSKIQPFHIYYYWIISWINIGLGNVESQWIRGWKFQGTLLGARSPYCIKQNFFRNLFLRYIPSIYTPIVLYLEQTSGSEISKAPDYGAENIRVHC